MALWICFAPYMAEHTGSLWPDPRGPVQASAASVRHVRAAVHRPVPVVAVLAPGVVVHRGADRRLLEKNWLIKAWARYCFWLLPSNYIPRHENRVILFFLKLP